MRQTLSSASPPKNTIDRRHVQTTSISIHGDCLHATWSYMAAVRPHWNLHNLIEIQRLRVDVIDHYLRQTFRGWPEQCRTHANNASFAYKSCNKHPGLSASRSQHQQKTAPLKVKDVWCALIARTHRWEKIPHLSTINQSVINGFEVVFICACDEWRAADKTAWNRRIYALTENICII